MESGTCTDCLRFHIVTQFDTRGASNIRCIQSHTLNPDRIPDAYTILSQDWLPYAHNFLPSDQHDAYLQQLFDHYVHTTTTTLWVCPSKCGYGNGILQPHDTPGFPHVECPGCQDQFCPNCKVTWHTKQTCQQYRAAHPEIRDEDEVKQLHGMARLGARRCPRCQFIIIKDGGCDHVFCEQCHFDFNWPQAERVVAPVETFVPAILPAATTNTPAPTFRGWGQLRQVQEEYITRNNINDTPFNIGTAHTTHLESSIFYYDLTDGSWLHEACELGAIAARAAGKRFIRDPSHDRDYQWAFREVDHDHEGGVELQEALDELMAAAEPPEPPFHVVIQGGHVNDPNLAAPALAAFGRMINVLAAQKGSLADGGGGDARDGDRGGADDEAPHVIRPRVPPVDDDIERLVDQMLLGGLAGDGGDRRFVFGFGVGFPPAHMSEGGGESDPDLNPDSE